MALDSSPKSPSLGGGTALTQEQKTEGEAAQPLWIDPLAFCPPPPLHPAGASSGIIDLLPSPSAATNWTAGLLVDSSEMIFKFDGRQGAKIPDGIVPKNLTDQFTITMWMKHGPSPGVRAEKETILCNSDKTGGLPRPARSAQVAGHRRGRGEGEEKLRGRGPGHAFWSLVGWLWFSWAWGEAGVGKGRRCRKTRGTPRWNQRSSQWVPQNSSIPRGASGWLSARWEEESSS